MTASTAYLAVGGVLGQQQSTIITAAREPNIPPQDFTPLLLPQRWPIKMVMDK